MSKIGGRDCGACTACCEHLVIDSAEFRKPAGVLCEHCDGKGCGIYDTRPQVCRDYYCGWQQIPLLGEAWRPDHSGVLLIPRKKVEGAPQGLEFKILSGEAAVRSPGFAEFVALLVQGGAPVFMIVGDRGAQLNATLEPAVKARDIAGVRELLLRIYAGGTSHSDKDVLPPV